MNQQRYVDLSNKMLDIYADIYQLNEELSKNPINGKSMDKLQVAESLVSDAVYHLNRQRTGGAK